MEMLNHTKITVTGSIFLSLPPYAREKNNLLDDAGIEPGPPARQAAALSITPCLSGLIIGIPKDFLSVLLRFMGGTALLRIISGRLNSWLVYTTDFLTALSYRIYNELCSSP